MNDMNRMRDLVEGKLSRVEAPVASAELIRRARRRRTRSLVGAGVVGASCLAVLVIALGLLLPLGGRGGQPANDATPATTPVNGELLYAKYVGTEGWSLFALDPATGRERRITHGYRDYGSDWSPDGSKVIYDSETEQSARHDIIVANADGSHATVVAEDGSVPAWSPDGTQIAFARPDLGKMISFGEGSSGTPYYLYMMGADGTDVRQITRGDHSDYFPAWSPTGRQVVFLRQGAGVFVMNADGTGLRKLTGSGVEVLSAPDWSPDGTSIAIAVNGERNGKPGGILLLHPDGSKSSWIPGTEAAYPDHVGNPAWSPDGQLIAYTRGYPSTIVISRPDGTDKRVLHPDPGEDSLEELAWGPADTSQGR